MTLNDRSAMSPDDPAAPAGGRVDDPAGPGPRLREHERQLSDLLRCRDEMASVALHGDETGAEVRPADRSALLWRLNDAIREKQMCLTRARRYGR